MEEQRFTNKSFNDIELKPCGKCKSDNIIRSVKEGNVRRVYDLFCYQCGHNVSAVKVELAVSKWNGTNVSNPSITKLLPCYVCEGEMGVTKNANDRYCAYCLACGKKERGRITRWDSVKTHNSNYKQMQTKKERLKSREERAEKSAK